MRILAINPGSTSTKIGVFDDEKATLIKTIRHSSDELSAFATLIDQIDFRKGLIENTLKDNNIDLKTFDAIIGRGGLLRPIESGTYRVTDKMLADLRSGLQGIHASNLGGILADKIAGGLGKPAFIADPVVVDELCDLARISGHPLFPRVSIFHALNHKAIARMYCKERKVKYEDVNLIVAHAGGGVSVGIHEKGRVVDVNNALDGEGPFSPERSGTLPVGALIDACFSGKYDKKQMRQMVQPRGGLVAYFNSNDFKVLCDERDAGDAEKKRIIDALGYQICKEIGAAATVVGGKVDAILLTGGMIYDPDTVVYIKKNCGFIAEVVAYPGEDEMSALALCALGALRNEIPVKEY